QCDGPLAVAFPIGPCAIADGEQQSDNHGQRHPEAKILRERGGDSVSETFVIDHDALPFEAIVGARIPWSALAVGTASPAFHRRDGALLSVTGEQGRFAVSTAVGCGYAAAKSTGGELGDWRSARVRRRERRRGVPALVDQPYECDDEIDGLGFM